MDTLYKQQLCSKLDHIAKLERSGYGIPRENHSDDTKAFVAMVFAIVAIWIFVLAIAPTPTQAAWHTSTGTHHVIATYHAKVIKWKPVKMKVPHYKTVKI